MPPPKVVGFRKANTMKNTFIALFSNDNYKFLLWGIAVLLFLLITVMLLPLDTCFLMYLTGEKSKLELIKIIGWGMSGVIAIFGVMGLLQRAAALDKQNKMTEKGHIHERFKAATEHLGNERASVRIAAFSEFHHIAEIEPDLKEPILDILCAHLRQTTKDKDYYKDRETKPTEEVQSLLVVLFHPYKNSLIFNGMPANLKEVNLQHADLRGIYANGAYLQNAKLQWASIEGAELQNAKLQEANLFGATLEQTYLQNADMKDTDLENANLQDANLHGACMQGARINKDTIMPNDWESIVQQHITGKTGAFRMDKKGNIERL